MSSIAVLNAQETLQALSIRVASEIQSKAGLDELSQGFHMEMFRRPSSQEVLDDVVLFGWRRRQERSLVTLHSGLGCGTDETDGERERMDIEIN